MKVATVLLDTHPAFCVPPGPLTDAHSAAVRAALNYVDSDGSTPLLYAVKSNKDGALDGLVSRLVAHPAVDVSATVTGDARRPTAAHLAAGQDGAAAVKLLRLFAARDPALLSAPDSKGRPPLLYATDDQVASYLLGATQARTDCAATHLRVRLPHPSLQSVAKSA